MCTKQPARLGPNMPTDAAMKIVCWVNVSKNINQATHCAKTCWRVEKIKQIENSTKEMPFGKKLERAIVILHARVPQHRTARRSRRRAAQHSTAAQHTITQCSTTRHHTQQTNTRKHNATQSSAYSETKQHNAVPGGAAQHQAARHHTKRRAPAHTHTKAPSGTKEGGLTQHNCALHGAKRHYPTHTMQHGAGQRTTVQNGTAQQQQTPHSTQQRTHTRESNRPVPVGLNLVHLDVGVTSAKRRLRWSEF